MRSVRVALLTVAVLLASCATTQGIRPNGPEVALTVDDLPLHGPIPEGETPQSVGNGVIRALSQAHVPAYGFVNAHWTADQPATTDVLKNWRAAGFELGNHTWSHQHLSTLSPGEFQQEVIRDEPALKTLASGTDWHWFRYPFLDEGKDAAQRRSARDLLASRGYKIADVTMDFSDWQWTAPYARCRAAGDDQSIAKLDQLYLAAARDAIGFYRGLSHKLYGRDIPYVILLHESAFEARMLPQLIRLFRSEGFRFVSLPVAERDPFYRDRVDPELAAGPAGLVDHAYAAGVKPPPFVDYGARLGGICAGVGTAPIGP